MGVYVEGMEMQETCIECINSGLRTAIRCSEWTKISAGLRENHRTLSCPLVEVPEPHGRLIDAEKLKNEYQHNTDWDYPVNTNCYVCESIDNAPTVIEAEGEG